jgi:hypothetical protein
MHFMHASIKTTPSCARGPPPFHWTGWSRSEADVSKAFNLFNTRKATGQDGSHNVWHLHSHFQPLLVPVCNPPVSSWPPSFLFPRTQKATCHNDYGPVALTSVIIKCFERLVMAHINSIIPDTLVQVSPKGRSQASSGS